MGSKIGVPVQYIEKCLKSGREVLARDNMNSWLSDYHKDLFIRCYKDKIRGVLSSKYSVCDSHEILEVLKDVVNLNKYTVKGSFINEERLHLRLIGNEKLPINGEDLFAGIFLDSSDVGRSILKVNFGIYKQVCTNGLIISRAGGTLFKQKHIGISSEDFYEGLYESMSNVDILVENAVSFVEMASNTSSGYDVASLSKEEMEEFAEEIRNRTKLSQEGAEKVINLMQYKYDSSKWGLINGITEVAQDYTLERRLELETIAGNLLTA